MKLLILLLAIISLQQAIAQSTDSLSSQQKLMQELADNACNCVDTFNHYNKSKDEINKFIHDCINEQTRAYLLGLQLMTITDSKKLPDTGAIRLSINFDEKSGEYLTQYFEMERYLMENCKAIKSRIAANEKHNSRSVSENPDARKHYSLGQDEMQQGLYQLAVVHFENAVKTDPAFAFAWDNIGVCYRKLGEYDKAIKAYKKSIEIDPEGTTPLQNIAVVYRYKKEFKKAIDAYERLAVLNKNDPEVYYGLGQVYAGNLGELEKGLSYLCKAYNLYIEQKSPYRSEAEQMINAIYKEMKEKGKEKRFQEILAENNISPE